MAGKNKNQNAQYALIALIVALAACISTALIGAVKGVLALEMFSLDESTLNTVNIIFQVSIALIFIGLAVYAILVPDKIRRFLSGRQARYGSNSLIMIVAFLGIVFAVNYLAYQNPDFLGAPWDFTEDQSNTLTPETLQTLASLPAKVTATGFFTDNLSSSEAGDLLKRYKENSNGKFEYSFVNPDLDPIAAREAGITGDGKILLQMGETKEIASYADESEITKALIRLISPEKRVVYFLQGHGEAPLDFSDTQAAMTIAKETLESKNYTVSELNLLNTKEIPEDAELIVIAGPMKPLTSDEVNRLKTYVDNGGALLVMQNPIPVTEFGNSPDPLNEYLTNDWGISFNNDLVIDFVNTQNPLQAVSSNVGFHPITQNLTQNYIVILPQARSLSITGEKENITQTALLLTTEQSYGETNLNLGEDSSFTPEFNQGEDIQGPLNLAVAAENSATNGRVVVFGNSLFATDDVFDVYGNGNIFVNSVDWAAEQEDLINLTFREPKIRTFTPPGNLQFILIIVMAIFVLPGAVVLAGITSWIARRRKG